MEKESFGIEELKAYIITRTGEHWKANQRPILLSDLGVELGEKCDYRLLIAPLKLRQFIHTYLAKDVTPVTHPTIKQKTGTIPYGETFTFEIAGADALRTTRTKSQRIKPTVWAAFVKPLPEGFQRYIDVSNEFLRFKDLSDPLPGNIAHLRSVPEGSIKDTSDPDYNADDIVSAISQWALDNHVPIEKTYFVEPKAPSTGKFFEQFQVLSESDLRRIDIPFDIVVKLARK